MCFQSHASGSLHSLLPNAPENNPTVFFPRLAGNDLTTARKRNAKHSLELFVTSERWGGPCASASLDIPDQPKLPTAGVNRYLAPTPKQSQKQSPPCEALLFTSGSRVFTIVKWEHQVFTLKNTHLYNLKDFRRTTSSKPPIQCLLSSLPCMYCVTRALSNCPQQCIFLCRFWAPAKRWFRKKNQR